MLIVNKIESVFKDFVKLYTGKMPGAMFALGKLGTFHYSLVLSFSKDAGPLSLPTSAPLLA